MFLKRASSSLAAAAMLVVLSVPAWATHYCITSGSAPIGTIEPCTTPATQQGSISVGGEERFDFAAASGGNYSFSICAAEGGSASWDTTLSITNPGGTQVACNDDACSVQSRLAWVAPSSANYVVRVGGFGSGSGSYTMAYSSDIACAAGGPAVPAASTWSLIAAGFLVMLAATGRLGRTS